MHVVDAIFRVRRSGALRRAAAGWALACGLLGGIVTDGRAAGVSREPEVKAALVFNFTQFVEWPPAAFASADAPFVIGILGDDPFGGLLDRVVEQEQVAGHRMVVVRYRDPTAAMHSHLLFISGSERAQFPRILAMIRHRPILTVAEFDGFPDRGGVVQLHRGRDHKFRLRVNLESARAAGLTLSAKLLRVAEIVTPGRE